MLRSCPVTAAAGVGTAQPSWVASRVDGLTPMAILVNNVHLEAVQPGRYLALGAWSSPDAWSLPAWAWSRCAAS
jgi:hypothetical protein